VTTFCAVLREMRLSRPDPISQMALGNRLGMDHSIVSRWESGQRWPLRENVAACADALGLTGDDRARLFLAADYRPDEPGVWITGVVRIGDGR